jgi:hypothetical protein
MATAIGAYATTSSLKALIGTTDSNDDTLLGLICDRTNALIEERTGRVIAPVSSATFLLDGDGSDRLYFPRGIRAITSLGVATRSQPSTGGTYTTQTSTNYDIRPLAQDRQQGWPAFWVCLLDTSTQSRYFPKGYNTVTMTATTGWAAIPDEITDLALQVAQRAWNARQQGFQDVAGVDEMGRPVVARFLSGRDRVTLDQYTLPVLG